MSCDQKHIYVILYNICLTNSWLTLVNSKTQQSQILKPLFICYFASYACWVLTTKKYWRSFQLSAFKPKNTSPVPGQKFRVEWQDWQLVKIKFLGWRLKPGILTQGELNINERHHSYSWSVVHTHQLQGRCHLIWSFCYLCIRSKVNKCIFA